MKKLHNSIKLVLTTLLLSTSSQAIAQYDTFENNDSCFPSSWCPSHYFIRGDLLYLRAFEDGLSNPCEPSCTLEYFDCDNRRITASQGRGKEPHFKWDLGYRVGAGIEFQDCKWDVEAYWTHFSPDHTKEKCNRPSWKLDYDTIDLLIGYKCDFNNCFTLDAFGGLRAARINQKLRSTFVSINRDLTQRDDSIAEFVSQSKIKQDFEGIGFIFGLKGDFDFGCGITFFLAGDAGTLVGRNKLHSIKIGVLNSESAFISGFKRHQEACQYFVDSAIGIRWQKCLCNNMSVIIELGYESHNYFNHNRMKDEGNLYISGGNLAASLQF